MCEACLIEDLSRRGLLHGTAGAGLAAWLGGRPRGALAAEPVAPDVVAPAEPDEVAPGVFFLMGETRYFQDGTQAGAADAIRSLMCNNGWVVLGDHVLIIDANMPARADTLLAAVRRTTDKPVRFLFNTHHHGDHVYGNRVVAGRTGAAVVAYSGMAEELRRYETGAFGGQPGRWKQVAKLRPDVAAAPVMAPTQVFEQALVLDGADGRRVELLHPGLGHTRGDAVAWLPNERVLFTGDLASTARSTLSATRRWRRGWTRSPPCRRSIPWSFAPAMAHAAVRCCLPTSGGSSWRCTGRSVTVCNGASRWRASLATWRRSVQRCSPTPLRLVTSFRTRPICPSCRFVHRLSAPMARCGRDRPMVSMRLFRLAAIPRSSASRTRSGDASCFRSATA